jgi:serine/threonine-protein kinase HipA
VSAKPAPALNVLWRDDSLVGKVVAPGPTEFAYLPDWVAGGHNLSPLKVPFTPALYRMREQDFDHLPGFLSDCLPDQWGRRIMNEDFSVAGIKPTPMKMLAWVGSRAIGALQFSPALAESEESATWTPVTGLLLAREAQAILRNAPPDAFVHLRRAGTAGGAFPKATVLFLPDGHFLSGGNVANVLNEHAGARLGLLKLDVEDDPTRASTDGRMEFAYMQMARAAGIQTALCEVHAEPDQTRDRHHLFVQRFDVQAETGLRIHMVTLAGILEDHNLNYRHLFTATRDLTGDRTQLMEAIRRMVFNVRAANGDDHGKNHSFLYEPGTRRWSLSPAYDLTLNYSSERNFSGLFPNTFGKSPRQGQLVEVCAEYDVTNSEFSEVDAQVAATIARWPEFAAAAGLSPEDTARASALHAHVSESLQAAGRSSSPRRTRRRW